MAESITQKNIMTANLPLLKRHLLLLLDGILQSSNDGLNQVEDVRQLRTVAQVDVDLKTNCFKIDQTKQKLSNSYLDS